MHTRVVSAVWRNNSSGKPMRNAGRENKYPALQLCLSFSVGLCLSASLSLLPESSPRSVAMISASTSDPHGDAALIRSSTSYRHGGVLLSPSLLVEDSSCERGWSDAARTGTKATHVFTTRASRVKVRSSTSIVQVVRRNEKERRVRCKGSNSSRGTVRKDMTHLFFPVSRNDNSAKYCEMNEGGGWKERARTPAPCCWSQQRKDH